MNCVLISARGKSLEKSHSIVDVGDVFECSGCVWMFLDVLDVGGCFWLVLDDFTNLPRLFPAIYPSDFRTTSPQSTNTLVHDYGWNM